MKKDSHSVQVVTPPVLENHKVQPPSKVISLNRAVTYYNNFYQTRLATSTKNAKRAVWFEFDALQKHFKHVISFCADKNIEITRFAFLLGADKNNARTIVIAPVTYDEQLDLHRAFSFDNDEITYIHRFAGEKFSSTTNHDKFQSIDQSLILSDSGLISSSQTITLYNNYYNAIIQPFSEVIASDTRFVYYEKGEFEGYLDYLKKNADNNKLNLSGLNIVFGVHDNNEKEGVYANHLTLFFAPTLGKTKSISPCSFDLHNEQELDFSKNELVPRFNTNSIPLLSCLFNRGQSGPPPFGWD